jgi:hypothetical protein
LARRPWCCQHFKLRLLLASHAQQEHQQQLL